MQVGALERENRERYYAEDFLNLFQSSLLTQDYYTYRIRIIDREHVQAEIRDPAGTIKGEPYGRLTYDGKFREQAYAWHQAAQKGQIDGPQIRALGEGLFAALFDEWLRRDFFRLYEEVCREGALMRIELDVDEHQLPDLAALPWEFMCVPSRYRYGTMWLGTVPDLIFSRQRVCWKAQKSIQLEKGEPLRIALAVAAPREGTTGTVEYRKTWEALKRLAEKRSSQVKLLEQVNPATRVAIDEVLAQKPHIFHFVGFARLRQYAQQQAQGQIALVDGFLDEPLWISAQHFGELFTRHRPKMVFLQSGESAAMSVTQASVSIAHSLLEQSIPVVVGMQYRISNSTAARFALKFYERLAKGDPVDKAVQEGRRRIALGPTGYSKRDFATPVLFKVDPKNWTTC